MFSVLFPLAPDIVVSALTAKVELKVVAPVTAKVPAIEAAAVDKDNVELLPNPSVRTLSEPLNGPLSVTLIRLSYVSCGVVPVNVVPSSNYSKLLTKYSKFLLSTAKHLARCCRISL